MATQLVRLGRRLQRGDGRDAELLPDPPGGLRPEAGQPHEDRDLGGHLRLALRQRVNLAVGHDLDDLVLDRLADALQSLRLPVERELRDRRRRLANPRGCLAVGPDPEPVRALELHQVGEQIELFREQLVPRKFGHVAIIGAPMRATVCLPTYNERENLEPMLRALEQMLRAGDRVLVIDDASPDGTGELADRLASELGLRRRAAPTAERGARAGLPGGLPPRARHQRRADSRDGLRLLAQSAGRARLIAAAEEGADLGLGSRYVPGGRVGNWGLVRRAISRGASLYTALFLQMGVKDPTGGFKCFRRRVLETIDLDAITRGDTPSRSRPPTGSSRPDFESSRSRSPSTTGPQASRR